MSRVGLGWVRRAQYSRLDTAVSQRPNTAWAWGEGEGEGAGECAREGEGEGEGEGALTCK